MVAGGAGDSVCHIMKIWNGGGVLHVAYELLGGDISGISVFHIYVRTISSINPFGNANALK